MGWPRRTAWRARGRSEENTQATGVGRQSRTAVVAIQLVENDPQLCELVGLAVLDVAFAVHGESEQDLVIRRTAWPLRGAAAATITHRSTRTVVARREEAHLGHDAGRATIGKLVQQRLYLLLVQETIAVLVLKRTQSVEWHCEHSAAGDDIVHWPAGVLGLPAL